MVHNFPATVEKKKHVCLCVHIFMQIKAANELRVALISVLYTTPQRLPYFISTDNAKPCLIFFLVTAIGSRSKPELCFLLGRLR